MGGLSMNVDGDLGEFKGDVVDFEGAFGDFSELDLAMSDELSCDDSGDEEGGVPRKKWPEFNKSVDIEKPTFTLGMLFPSADVLVEAIRSYAIKAWKEVKIKNKERKKVKVVCKEPCKWLLYASML